MALSSRNSMQAIPTKYASTEFRSRLEARWAAFFDLIGWDWEYEPIDLPGWIPDFLLKGCSSVLVEIKPADSLEGFDLHKIRRGMSVQPGDAEVLLLGRNPQLGPNGFGEEIAGSRGVPVPIFGWLYENDGEEVNGSPYASEASMLFDDANALDFCSFELSWHGRLTGFYQGNSVWRNMTNSRVALLQDLWREAGNITRWNRPRFSAALRRTTP